MSLSPLGLPTLIITHYFQKNCFSEWCTTLKPVYQHHPALPGPNMEHETWNLKHLKAVQTQFIAFPNAAARLHQTTNLQTSNAAAGCIKHPRSGYQTSNVQHAHQTLAQRPQPETWNLKPGTIQTSNAQQVSLYKNPYILIFIINSILLCIRCYDPCELKKGKALFHRRKQ